MRKLLGGTLAALVVLGSAAGVRADDKEVRALLDKAIKAHGGAEKLDKYQAATLKLKGKITIMGMDLDFTGDVAEQLPDKIRSEITLDIQGKQVKVVEVLNKGKGWYSADGKTMDMTKEMLAEAREQMNAGGVAQQLTPLKGKEFTLAPLGESKVGGAAAVGIRASRKGYRDVSLYFDKKSGLLLKTERRAKDVMQGDAEFTEETFYYDYKEVSGVQVPYRVTQKRDGKDFLSAKVSEAKVEEKLDDSHFAKP